MPPSKRQPKPETFDQAFRSVLRDLRIKKGWTQSQLAANAGYGQNYVSNIETGKQDPRFSVVFNLVQTLGTRPDLYMKAVVKRTQPKPAEKRARTKR
jgi:transcriptional regulator with XRE-family HTH domain